MDDRQLSGRRLAVLAPLYLTLPEGRSQPLQRRFAAPLLLAPAAALSLRRPRRGKVGSFDGGEQDTLVIHPQQHVCST
jgi:hypothetical protein